MSVRRLWWLYGGTAAALWFVLVIVAFMTPRASEQIFRSYTTPVPLLPTPTQIQMVEQVIAVQVIPAGFTIPPEALTLRPVPLTVSVRGGYTDIDDVAGKIAALSIQREQIITDYMLQAPNLAPDVRATATEQARFAPPTSMPAPGNAITLLPTATPVSFTNVVVPVYVLPAGTTITANDVIVRPFPVDAAPLNTASDVNNVIGKVTTADLPADYPVLLNTLTDASTPNAPTPLPPPEDACVVTIGAAQGILLYDSSDAVISSGALRPETVAVAVAQDAQRYQIELPGGLPLGWVSLSQVSASGECEGV